MWIPLMGDLVGNCLALNRAVDSGRLNADHWKDIGQKSKYCLDPGTEYFDHFD